MPTVQILLSTYNGERFLGELLDSLLAQDHPHWTLSVRDDGSSDATLRILRDFGAAHPGRLARLGGDGANLGPALSFLALARECPADADYYAWCDQDDIWMPDKLSTAVQRLQRDGRDLYFSALDLVDEQGRRIGASPAPRVLSFDSALVQNVASGCAIVFGRRVFELLRRSPPDPRILMHDWWTYLLAQALDGVCYDPQPRVRYRQHGGNVVGASRTAVEAYRRKWQRFVARKASAPRVSDQARVLRECFGPELPAERLRALDAFLDLKRSGWQRLRTALRTDAYPRQGAGENLIFRLLMLGNRM